MDIWDTVKISAEIERRMSGGDGGEIWRGAVRWSWCMVVGTVVLVVV